MQVLTWGCGEKGRLGRLEGDAKMEDSVDRTDESRFADGGATYNRLVGPAAVPGLSHVTTVAAGYYCSHAITASGAVYCWGLNNYGQLALPRITSATEAAYYKPTRRRAECYTIVN